MVQALGFAALLGFVYAFNSRVLDMSFYYLHLPLVLGVVTGVCALVAGSLFKAFKTRVGILYLGLTCWFAAGVPFAYYRGGSARNLEGWLRTLVIWAFLVGLTVTYRGCKLLLNAIVLAAATAALMGLFGGGATVAGRLSLERGQFSNPNYFAMELLITLPFVWRLYSGGGRPGVFRRLLAAGVGGVMFVALFRSGSRAGLYALGAMVLLVILRVGLARKIQIAFAAGLLFTSIFAVLPRYLRERYFTFSSTEGEQYQSVVEANTAGGAASSTLERQHVLRQSISITLKRPVFGVGLGNFSAFVYQLNRDAGRKKEPYLGTHNSYTQISSEAGIPALLILLGIMAMSWRSLTRLIRATRHDERPKARDIYHTAHAAQVCLGTLGVFLLFIHMAYDILPHMLLGMALAVAYTGERELRDLDAQQLPPVAGDNSGHPGILFSGGSTASQISKTAERRAAVWEKTAEGRHTSDARAGSPRPV